jgi:hypothetical protein
MKKNHFLKFALSTAMVATFFVSCETESVEETDLISTEVRAKLESLGFNTDNLMEDSLNGISGYTVEGDIFLTENQINEMAPANGVGTEHYRTSNIVGPAGRVINVYMDADFNNTMQAAFDDALGRYNALNLDITFQRSSSANADIEVLSQRLKKVRGGGTILGRSAGFPDAAGNPASPIVLNSTVYNPRRGGIPADAATVIAHEIGHAIGFRHTDFDQRQYSCGGSPADEGQAGVGAIYIPGTPSGPEAGSWMLACSNGTDRPFTGGDQTALTTVY